MKKISILFVMIIMFIIFTTGCSLGKNDNEESLKLSEQLAASFKAEIKKETDIKKVAETLAKSELIKSKLEVTEIKKSDYITGFETEITGFNNAVVVRPIVGAIPFIMYIFESNNPSSFATMLEENAKLNWNICTEADEMKTEVYQNYIFFIMTPATFEE